jgi:hypothetical protein
MVPLNELLNTRREARAGLDSALIRIRLLTAEWQATGVKPAAWKERAAEARAAQVIFDEANKAYQRALITGISRLRSRIHRVA